MRCALIITAVAAVLGACTATPSPTAGPGGGPASTTVPAATATTTASTPSPRGGKIETLAAAVTGGLNASDSPGQGLTRNGDSLLESTNAAGIGGIRALDAATGALRTQLADQPGRTTSGVAVTERPGTPATVWQLTKHDNVAVARDRTTLAPQRQVAYEGEGWGLCDDGTQLVQSDGTMRLTLRDAITFAAISSLEVTGGWWSSSRLGELECVQHHGHRAVWANLIGTSWLIRVDLQAQGAVTAIADLSPALAAVTSTSGITPIDGIAAVGGTGTDTGTELWLTGNGWRSPLRIRLTPRP